jgi:DNA mismatch repair protein MutL
VARKIQILPDTVANRIAAGEVVERPASVLKELLENALDAGAQAIAIEIEQGGKTLIRVADDGEGMGRDDALLALDRHATSKLRRAEDLVGVATFGFRGEALPSIASVSRFEMETSDDEGLGTRVTASGGLITAIDDIARQRGTTIAVRGLFHNTPARRKFLRSARSETRACVDTVQTLALARPSLGVMMLADSRQAVEALPAAGLPERVAQVLGRELAATMVPVESAGDGIRISGLVQRPADAAPAGRSVYLLVNRRPFKDHFIVRAAERGYRGTIPAGLRPSMVLALEVPAADVDVNVHPAKLEVRFRDRFAIEAAVESAVHAALGELVAAAPFRAGAMPWEHLAMGGDAGHGVPDTGLGTRGAAEAEEGDEPGAADSQSLFDEPRGPGHESRSPDFRVVAQIHDSYILVESAEGLLIVDQHSAHERVLFERAMTSLNEGGAASQKLLFPLTIELAPAELDALEANDELIAKLGYEALPFGGRSVIVHAAPAPHPRFDAERCLREIVADMAGGRFGALANRMERFASTFACRAAIKAGHPLTRPEMEELISLLFASSLPAHDVHGRPTIVQLPRIELERRFGRR